MNPTVTMEIWGPLACWTRPEGKVERLTYPAPTPSGVRGILSAIYCKPPEFYWQVRKIELLKPIQYVTFRRNELKSKMSTGMNPMYIEDDRTQRQSVMLADVRYRITADIVPQPSCPKPPEEMAKQFDRRLKRGQCFFQPCLGLKELVGYFGEATSDPPIGESLDLGLMLYDVFDLHKFEKTKKAEPYVTLYRAKLENGVINVPPFDDAAVLRPGKE